MVGFVVERATLAKASSRPREQATGHGVLGEVQQEGWSRRRLALRQDDGLDPPGQALPLQARRRALDIGVIEDGTEELTDALPPAQGGVTEHHEEVEITGRPKGAADH